MAIDVATQFGLSLDFFPHKDLFTYRVYKRIKHFKWQLWCYHFFSKSSRLIDESHTLYSSCFRGPKLSPSSNFFLADGYISSDRYLRGRIQWLTFYFPFQQRSFSVQTFRNFKCHRTTLHRDIRDEMPVLDVELISDRGRGNPPPFPTYYKKK